MVALAKAEHSSAGRRLLILGAVIISCSESGADGTVRNADAGDAALIWHSSAGGAVGSEDASTGGGSSTGGKVNVGGLRTGGAPSTDAATVDGGAHDADVADGESSPDGTSSSGGAGGNGGTSSGGMGGTFTCTPSCTSQYQVCVWIVNVGARCGNPPGCNPPCDPTKQCFWVGQCTGSCSPATMTYTTECR